MKVAVIGAGLAGLACARRLSANGISVELFDKGRGPGGRMSTRRMETPAGTVRWDHGAQFFTVRDPGFQTEVDALMTRGAVARWEGRFLSLSEEGEKTLLPDEPRYVGTPGMNGLIRALAADDAVKWDQRVIHFEGQRGNWTLAFGDDTTSGPYDLIVLAVPAEQAFDLLQPISDKMAADAMDVVSAPCWAIMVYFEAPFVSPGQAFNGMKVKGHPISWIARNASKPDRTSDESWILHASPEWSKENLERSPEDVLEELLVDFASIVPEAPRPAMAAAHRWRFALVERPADTPFDLDTDLGVGVCGDWRIGPRVEAAWLSGDQLGAAIVSPRA